MLQINTNGRYKLNGETSVEVNVPTFDAQIGELNAQIAERRPLEVRANGTHGEGRGLGYNHINSQVPNGVNEFAYKPNGEIPNTERDNCGIYIQRYSMGATHKIEVYRGTEKLWDNHVGVYPTVTKKGATEINEYLPTYNTNLYPYIRGAWTHNFYVEGSHDKRTVIDKDIDANVFPTRKQPNATPYLRALASDQNIEINRLEVCFGWLGDEHLVIYFDFLQYSSLAHSYCMYTLRRYKNTTGELLEEQNKAYIPDDVNYAYFRTGDETLYVSVSSRGWSLQYSFFATGGPDELEINGKYWSGLFGDKGVYAEPETISQYFGEDIRTLK